jgi:nitric oxide reductase subunit B
MKKYWISFSTVIIISFLVLGWIGVRIYQEAPPIPEKVVTSAGETVFTKEDIQEGQNIWQALGGMEVGSVWGHGSYVAPDWTADWLHREAMFTLNYWANEEFHKEYQMLGSEQQAALNSRLKKTFRENRYDKYSGIIVIDPVRAKAVGDNIKHFSNLFLNGNDAYAIRKNALTDSEKLRKLNAFFFWTSWAASTNRPNDDVTYTGNWPHEELTGNQPTGDAIVWTGVSIILLLAGIGGMIWYYGSKEKETPKGDVPVNDPLLGSIVTPSQRAVIKYFWVVTGLLVVQIVMGIVTAHYGVEGNALYGIPLAQFLPYTITRTWHVQIGIFWIATAWLAAGLYIGPAVSGREPKYQKLGVNVLFIALLLVVVGSMAGQWLSVMNKLSGNSWFLFGHSGYEYIDLGRIFQAALFIGLLLWLVLMIRAILPALKKNDEQKPILTLFLTSTIAIALFYGAALMYGRHSNLSVVEYWRWWVVHLWVEGFFEVFATVVIAFLFARLKLVSLRTSGQATLFASTIYLSGGIIGTLHHLYFSGTPMVVLALGSVFSALEVVPLVFVGYEAWGNIRLSKSKDWVRKYKWPINYFIAVAFWNLVGAGLFGFMINPPIALYYMQGLNTTPLHGHAALFGVYGMLGIGLMLFTLRAIKPEIEWKEKQLKFSFWAINTGLLAMVLLSLLPVGLMQTWASVKYGYWYARSSEFLTTPIMTTLKWSRALGDSIFAIGVIVLAIFIIGLTLKFRKK